MSEDGHGFHPPAYVREAFGLAVEAKRYWSQPDVYADHSRRHEAAETYGRALRALHTTVDVWVAEATRDIAP